MASAEPEYPVFFNCAGAQLLGILHRGAPGAQRAVLVVVGGPQYRVGSHRQFVLLARRLAAAGIPTLRFDYRGMGDSDGYLRSFEDIQDDIAAAIDCLFTEVEGLQQVVLWGLCDAASAGAIYAPRDRRLAGLVMLNPWVRTPEGEAKAYLQHYYTGRLLSRSFWVKLFSGDVNLTNSLRALHSYWRSAKGQGHTRTDTLPTDGLSGISDPFAAGHRRRPALPERMLCGLNHFPGRVLLILSGNDLTAKEFEGLVESDQSWARWALGKTVERRDLTEADHTFSTTLWRDQVEVWTLAWLQSW